MVCGALGIDSAGYSLPYVASWSGGDVAKVTATANRVIGCARTVLTEIEHRRERQMDPPSNPSFVQTPYVSADERSVRPELEEVLEASVTFYRHQLDSEGGDRVFSFLRCRGIGEDEASLWQLGCAPNSWRSLTTALLDQGFTEDLLIEAGVAGRARTGRLYDRMRNRLVFPIFDRGERPRGLAGRVIDGDGPKYLNTPETELYRKRSLLYGLHLAQEPIRKIGSAVVVEGYLDVIACHKAGFNNVVATAGTALTSEHLTAIGQITQNAVLAFDGDQGGRLAVSRVSENNADHPLQLRVAHLPESQDPADLLAKDSITFEQALADAVPIVHHLIAETVHRHNLSEPEGVARAVHQAGQLVATVRDSDDRDRAVELMATLIGRPESSIRAYLMQASRTGRTRRPMGDLGLGVW
jgi:DNA primase